MSKLNDEMREVLTNVKSQQKPVTEGNHNKFCDHKDKNGDSIFVWIMRDARGIPIGHVCDNCVEAKKATYRPEVFTDVNYECDEPIEPEDY